MKIRSTHKRIILTFFAALSLAACSGQQQDEENLEATQENNQGDLGKDDAGEGNGQENFVDGQGKEEGEDGAAANSDTSNDAAAGGELNPTLNGSGGDAATNLAANPGANPAGNLAGGNPAGGMNPAPAPANAAPTEQSPVQGGRVRYVKTGGVQVVNAPGGSPVATLDQGEHPVTWEENGYLKIANGFYVPVDGMSDQGVPRPGNGAGWTK